MSTTRQARPSMCSHRYRRLMMSCSMIRRTSEQAKELEAINSLLEEYVGRPLGPSAAAQNLQQPLYCGGGGSAIVRWMLEDRFDILDEARCPAPGRFDHAVHRRRPRRQELYRRGMPYRWPVRDVDGALGRGGDQAAVKTRGRYRVLTAALRTAWRSAATSAAALSPTRCATLSSAATASSLWATVWATWMPSARRSVCCGCARCAVCPPSLPLTARPRWQGHC